MPFENTDPFDVGMMFSGYRYVVRSRDKNGDVHREWFTKTLKEARKARNFIKSVKADHDCWISTLPMPPEDM